MKTNETAAVTASPLVIPDHQLLRKIATGAYGEIWLARNVMGTYRAVKIVHQKGDSTALNRELAGIKNYEPISRSHEGLVDILQVGKGEADEYVYYVMELADDQANESGSLTFDEQGYTPKTLRSEIKRQGRLPIPECIEIARALSRALSHLHSKGLVHRDIKPSNIIFVNGCPKLADIGLVVEADDSRSVVGTEGFIAPEGPGSRKADIFALGVLMYEISTGCEHLHAPRLPDDIDVWIDFEKVREFNRVVVKACHPDATKRYTDAAAIGKHLLLLSEGQSLRQFERLQRQALFLRRAAPAIAAVVLLGAFVGYMIVKDRRQAGMIAEGKIAAFIARGSDKLAKHDLVGALPYFVEALAADVQTDRQLNHRLRIGSVLSQAPELLQMWNAGEHVNDISFHPESGVFVASAWYKPPMLGGSEEDSLKVLPGGHHLNSDTAAFSHDGNRIVMTDGGGTIFVKNFPHGELVQTLFNSNYVFHVEFDSTGDRVISSSEDNKARIWNVRKGDVEVQLDGHTAPVIYGELSRSGRFAITASQDSTARLWDASTGQPLVVLKHGNWVLQARFSPDESRAVTCSFDRTAREWEIPSGRPLPPPIYHDRAVNVAAYSSDGRLMLTADWGGLISIWDAWSRLPWRPVPHLYVDGRILDAEFSPDMQTVALGTHDGSVQLWRIEGVDSPAQPIRGWPSSKGRLVAAEEPDGLLIRDLETSDSTFLPVAARIIDTAFDDTGSFIGIRVQDEQLSRIEVWEIATRKKGTLSMSVPNGDALLWVASDGKRALAIVGQSLFVAEEGKALVQQDLPDHGKVAVNNAGSHVALARNQSLTVWDVRLGKAAWPALTAEANISSVSFSQDGSRVVYSCRDPQFYERAAHVIATKDGRAVSPPLRHRDGVMVAAFGVPSNERHVVATSGEDALTLFWDASTGSPVGAPIEHLHKVERLAFSPNGRWIATGDRKGFLQLWDVETGEPLTQAFAYGDGIASLRWGLQESILVQTEDGDWWLHKLTFDGRAANELSEISRILSPQGFTSSTGGGREAITLWNELKKRRAHSEASSGDLLSP